VLYKYTSNIGIWDFTPHSLTKNIQFNAIQCPLFVTIQSDIYLTSNSQLSLG